MFYDRREIVNTHFLPRFRARGSIPRQRNASHNKVRRETDVKLEDPKIFAENAELCDSASKSVHIGYRPDIDGLRAIAVFSVVIFHAFPQFLKGGFVGVDVFFVLSGFLISSIILKNLDRGTFGFVDFYSRRVARIFPALLIVLAFCLVVGWFVLLPGEYRQLGKHVFAGSGFMSNIALLRESGYFDNAGDTKPLLHLWSLGVEEQFYIVWPLLVYIAYKMGLDTLKLILIVGLVSFVACIYGSYYQSAITFYSPHARVWELLVGAAYAWFTINYSKSEFGLKLNSCMSSSLIANALSVIGMSMLVAAICLIDSTDVFPGWWALLPVYGTLFVIMSGPNAFINRFVLSSKLFVWFGLISFPLYLWHWPLLSFANIMQGGTPSIEILAACVVLAVILAWLTFKLVEKNLKKIENTQRKIFSLLLAMACIGSLGFYTYYQAGFDSRMDKYAAIIDAIENPFKPIQRFQCSSVYPELSSVNLVGGCYLSEVKEPEVLFFGDSHANHYATSVWKYFEGTPAMIAVEFSCFPFASDVFMKGECKSKYDDLVSFIEKNKSIKQVYISGYWEYLVTGGFGKSGTAWRLSQPINSKDWSSFEKNARDFIVRVTASGKELIFMKNIPSLDFDIKTCYDIRPLRLTPSESVRQDCSVSYAQHMEVAQGYDDAFNVLLADYPQVKIYDPIPVLCKDDRCLASDNYLPYYLNGDHLNWYGADMIIKDLILKIGVAK